MGHGQFIYPGAAREFLDRLTVAVLGAKILAGVDTGRVVAQQGFYQAHALEKNRPVQSRHEPQAGDAVAD